MTQIFISYRRDDQTFAERLREKLHAWGCKTWMDIYNIPKGAYWPDEIDKGLASSDLVIGLVSSNTFESRNVKNEWDWALHNQKPLIPLLLNKPEMTPHRYISINHIDFRDETGGFSALQKQVTDPTTQYIDDVPIPVQTPVHSHTRTDDSNRSRMLQKVYDFWVVGVLENALRDSGAFDLGLEATPGAVLKHVDYGDYPLPTSTKIADVFEDMKRELLILGTPGAGKTILLLKLAQDLIASAQANDQQPIPVVFNLSSWAAGRKPLADWLIDELRTKYQVPKKVAKVWVEREQVLLLLDGLDEVAEPYREACVEAINSFRRMYRSVDMVVCSRVADYEMLTTKLDLQGAITLRPLSPEQIAAYIHRDELTGLREVMETDTSLQEMAGTPFLLNMMAYAYQDARPTTLLVSASDDPKKARRSHLFEAYVERRLKSTDTKRYTPRKTRDYVSWLASKMTKHQQIVFYIEGIQPTWFDSAWIHYLFLFLSRFVFGIFVGAIVGVVLTFITVILSPMTLATYLAAFNTETPTQLVVLFVMISLLGIIGGMIYGVGGLVAVALAYFYAPGKPGLLRTVTKLFLLAVGCIPLGIIMGLVLTPMLFLTITFAESIIPDTKFLEDMGAFILRICLYATLYVAIAAVPAGIIAAIFAKLRIKRTSWAYVLYAVLWPSLYFLSDPFLGVLVILIFGLIGRMVAGMGDRIESVEKIRWRWNWRYAGIGLLIGGGIGVIMTWAGASSEADIADIWPYVIIFLGAIGFCIGGGAGGFRKSQAVDLRIRPGRGITRTVQNTVKLVIGFALMGGFLGILFTFLMEFIILSYQFTLTGSTDSFRPTFVMADFVRAAGLGVATGIACGLIFGGSDVIIKHILLRVFLLLGKKIPRNYARFLDHAASIGLLRKVGGGYIFVHRYLLEYFAEMESEHSTSKIA